MLKFILFLYLTIRSSKVKESLNLGLLPLRAGQFMGFIRRLGPVLCVATSTIVNLAILGSGAWATAVHVLPVYNLKPLQRQDLLQASFLSYLLGTPQEDITAYIARWQSRLQPFFASFFVWL